MSATRCTKLLTSIRPAYGRSPGCCGLIKPHLVLVNDAKVRESRLRTSEERSFLCEGSKEVPFLVRYPFFWDLFGPRNIKPRGSLGVLSSIVLLLLKIWKAATHGMGAARGSSIRAVKLRLQVGLMVSHRF
jgi:hypothetical protein